jgi:SAM-dependent methyltransferase
MSRVEETHPWFVNRRRLVHALLRRFAAHIPRPRILDAGSGTGVNLAEYRLIGNVVGIEFDQGAAAISVRRGAEQIAVGDVCHLPFADAAFDLVISTDVIEHIVNDEAALREMRRVLKSGGRVVLTTPAYSWAYSSHDRFLHHVRRYDTGPLRACIDRADLRLVHESRYNVLLAVPVVAARWLGDRGTCPSNGSDVGRPLPRLAAPVLDFVWRTEAFLAARVNLRVGLTHVVVLERD